MTKKEFQKILKDKGIKPLNKKEMEIMATGYLMAVHSLKIRYLPNSPHQMTVLARTLDKVLGIDVDTPLERVMMNDKCLEISELLDTAVDYYMRVEVADKKDYR